MATFDESVESTNGRAKSGNASTGGEARRRLSSRKAVSHASDHT